MILARYMFLVSEPLDASRIHAKDYGEKTAQDTIIKAHAFSQPGEKKYIPC